jgi:hypothetical protein
MNTGIVNLLELSDCEKAKIVEEIRIMLHQELAEARLCRDFAYIYGDQLIDAKSSE